MLSNILHSGWAYMPLSSMIILNGVNLMSINQGKIPGQRGKANI